MDNSRRPMHIKKNEPISDIRDAFYMDFENECLREWGKEVPKGKKRHENKEWAEIIKSQVWPHHSDIDFQEYIEWVENGGGDEWFQETKVSPRCSGCQKNNDFCRCEGGIWWGG